MFSCELWEIFKNTFSQNIFGWLLLYFDFYDFYDQYRLHSPDKMLSIRNRFKLSSSTTAIYFQRIIIFVHVGLFLETATRRVL